MKRPFIYIIVMGLIALFLYNTYIKDPLAIERLIKAGGNALEEEDINKCFKYISLKYKDNWGNDYETLHKKTEQFFGEFDNLNIVILRKKKRFDKKICVVKLWLLIEADFSSIGPAKGQEHAKIELQKEDDKKWRVVNTSFGEKL